MVSPLCHEYRHKWQRSHFIMVASVQETAINTFSRIPISYRSCGWCLSPSQTETRKSGCLDVCQRYDWTDGLWSHSRHSNRNLFLVLFAVILNPQLRSCLSVSAAAHPDVSSLPSFGTEVGLVEQIYAPLVEQICLFSAACHTLSSASIFARPCYLYESAMPEICLHARSVFYHLGVWASCHSKHPSLIDPTTSWESLTLKYTDIVRGENRKRSRSPPWQEMRTLQPREIH